MLSRVPIAFAAGFLSVITPCVLPLVPGYLSAVSAVEAGRLGQPGSARRVLVGGLPFVVGFTVVFAVLGAAAAGAASIVGKGIQQEIAGFILVVLGLSFIGLLPLPQRIVAPGLVSGARRRGSSALLGAAFAVCAAPCIGGVLGGVLLLAGETGTVAQGALLLATYSAGLGAAFLLAGIAFARAMGVFRWLRDRYVVIRAASGVVLLGLGLLLFFDRYWWVQVYLNRALNTVGLGAG
jgi:cytochrome c-type biogenesis protein